MAFRINTETRNDAKYVRDVAAQLKRTDAELQATRASMSLTVTEVTANATVSSSGVYLCDTSSGNISISLAAAADTSGMLIHIKKTAAANAITIDASGAETIDGATTQTLLAHYECISITSNGTEWFII